MPTLRWRTSSLYIAKRWAHSWNSSPALQLRPVVVLIVQHGGPGRLAFSLHPLRREHTSLHLILLYIKYHQRINCGYRTSALQPKHDEILSRLEMGVSGSVCVYGWCVFCERTRTVSYFEQFHVLWYQSYHTRPCNIYTYRTLKFSFVMLGKEFEQSEIVQKVTLEYFELCTRHIVAKFAFGCLCLEKLKVNYSGWKIIKYLVLLILMNNHSKLHQLEQIR